MALKDKIGKALQSKFRAGEVNGSAFPIGTYINFGVDENENFILFTYPNDSEEKITHDMVKCATVLAMGVMDIKQDSKGTTLLHGTKYLCVLKDGRQAVLTVGVGNSQYRVESVLF